MTTQPEQPAQPDAGRSGTRSMVVRLVLLAALIGLIAWLTTQNGDDLSDEQEAAVESSRVFMQAVVDDDPEAACAVMAFDGVPVKDDEALTAPCVEGVGASADAEGRRKAYRLQMEADPEVGEVKDGAVDITWGKGDNTTDLTVVRIDDEWFVTY